MMVSFAVSIMSGIGFVDNAKLMRRDVTLHVCLVFLKNPNPETFFRLN